MPSEALDMQPDEHDENRARAIETAEELRVPPNFGAHVTTGDRKGLWSLTVTKN